MVIFPGCGPLKIQSHKWQSYGFDEFFMTVGAYPATGPTGNAYICAIICEVAASLTRCGICDMGQSQQRVGPLPRRELLWHDYRATARK